MSEIILHLGGNWRRIERTIQEAQRRPSAMVIVSTEGNRPLMIQALERSGIDLNRVIFDDSAYDTVGNFTDTYAKVRRLGGRTVYVVTSDWHMPRAMAIAKAAYTPGWLYSLLHSLTGIYAFATIRSVACPWVDDPDRKDPGNTIWDVSRTIQWRRTGRPTSRDYRP